MATHLIWAIEFSSHLIHNLECDRRPRENHLPRVCLTNAPLWRRPALRSFLINFIQSPPNGQFYLTALTEVQLWYFKFTQHNLWKRNNLIPARGLNPCWPCVWGKAAVSTWSAEGQREEEEEGVSTKPVMNAAGQLVTDTWHTYSIETRSSYDQNREGRRKTIP